MQKANQENQNENDVTGKRYFKCMYNNVCSGRYSGNRPKQAANKAFTAIVRNQGGNDVCTNKSFKFELVECTRGSARKTHSYEGTRKKLDTPLDVTIGSGDNVKKITYRYTNKVKKAKPVETVKTGGKSKTPDDTRTRHEISASSWPPPP